MTSVAVSVIVPTFNGETYIGETLASVLAQRFADLEVIVVDDESTDRTLEIVERFGDPRVRVARQPNRGVASARNAGLKAATGRFIAYCDQDDVWHPLKLARQLEAFSADSTVGVSATSFVFWHPGRTGTYPPAETLLRADPTIVLDPEYSGWIYHQMLLESCVLTSSALISRDFADELGDWDTSLEFAEDWDYWLRASRLGQFAWIAAPMVAYRQSAWQGSRVPRSRNWGEVVVDRAVRRWGYRGPDGTMVEERQFRRMRALAWRNFALHNLRAGALSRGLEAWREAVRLDPWNAENWKTLLRVYRR